jgi:hypothetical protein
LIRREFISARDSPSTLQFTVEDEVERTACRRKSFFRKSCRTYAAVSGGSVLKST